MELEDNEGIVDTDEKEKKQKQEAVHEAARIGLIVSDTMCTKSGRDFVWLLLERYQVYGDPFHENTNTMARNCGLKGAGLMLLEMILAECPDEYTRMFSENRYREEGA